MEDPKKAQIEAEYKKCMDQPAKVIQSGDESKKISGVVSKENLCFTKKNRDSEGEMNQGVWHKVRTCLNDFPLVHIKDKEGSKVREIIGLAPSKDPVVLTMKKDYSNNYVV